ncbi:MAG: 2-phosphosulfolactate phosphatase [Deltaproteobacteria bacterium]|nr:2-phosphosulfolactate phosphatase [Deltaproteobacteria bacterium]
MKIVCDRLYNGALAARGVAVIIDVFRAFTCAPLLFSMGVEKLFLIATPEQAFALKEKDRDLILVGEVSGIPIKGFDFGNSPSEILRKGPEFFEGRTVLQRTSSGVQGALLALDAADEVLLGSYALAGSTVKYLLSKKPEIVSLVAMGWELKEIAPEDEWCVRYLSHLLGNGSYDHNEALREIVFHKTTQRFLRREETYFPPEDPLICLQRDVYDFALRAVKQADRVEVHKISI